MESLERRTPPVARESRELRVLRFELAKPLLDHQLQQPLDYGRGLSEALESARHEVSLIRAVALACQPGAKWHTRPKRYPSSTPRWLTACVERQSSTHICSNGHRTDAATH